jgi:hypothetical protein
VPAPRPAAFEAVALICNALMTGVVLSLVSRHGEALAREFVQAHFRRQHLQKFLPGLRKLGLEREPHAVACALYHYHSNALGGVATEYQRESDRKAWVRYPPPRWIWQGTAACGIPHSVNVAMLHGWHGHNGVTLGNPRLGFVCTGTLTGGQPGLEGYYLEHDRELAPHERVRFADGERMPRVDPATQPRLDVDGWPAERRLRTLRSYALEYVRTLVPTLVALMGREAACAEIGRAARIVGMQFHHRLVQALATGPAPQASPDFAAMLAELLAAQGEQVTLEAGAASTTVAIRGWRTMDGVELDDAARAAALRAWAELWTGAALAHDRFMPLALHEDWPRGAVWTVG